MQDVWALRAKEGGVRPGRLELGVQSYFVVCVKDTSSVTYITCRPWEARGVTMTAGGGDGAKRGNREHQQVEVGGGQVAEGSGGVGSGPGVRPASVGGCSSQGNPHLPKRLRNSPGASWARGLSLGSSLGRPLGSWWLWVIAGRAGVATEGRDHGHSSRGHQLPPQGTVTLFQGHGGSQAVPY